METITISTLRENGYAMPGVSPGSDEEETQRIRAARYLESTATRMGVDISDLNLRETLVEEDGHITTDHPKINKAVWAHGEAQTQTNPEDVKLSDAQKALAEQIKQGSEGARLQELERRLQSKQSTIDYLLEDLENYTREITEVAVELEAEKARVESQTEHTGEKILKQILASPFWKVQSTHPGDATSSIFLLTPEVTMAYKKPAAGIDICQNMGSYKVNLEFRLGRLVGGSVHPFQNNTRVRSQGFYHPYIRHTGNICWGDAARQAQELMQAQNVQGYLELLQGLLTTYTPSSHPYAALEEFVEAQSQPGNTGARCDVCGERVGRCHCPTPSVRASRPSTTVSEGRCETCEEPIPEGEDECLLCN